MLYALIIAVLTLAWLGIVILATLRQRQVRDLPPAPEVWPTVTIIVAAMNEESTIEPAMRSLLALDYPKLDIVAVNDRSTDRTGSILDTLAAEHPGRLTVIHVDHLPERWLGKCHALHAAAPHARGEWLLFTDADVLFQPDALRTAVAFAVSGNADHIVLFPTMLWKGYMEAALLTLFTMAFTFGFQLWRVETRSKRAFVGVGAFNMIRRDLYEHFGGHIPLRLEVADDVKLGYLVKKHGGRSMTVNSGGKVKVRWREGVLDTVRGLERSGFAGLDFNWFKLVGVLVICLGIMLAPYVLPLFDGSPEVLWLSAGSIAMILLAYGISARTHGLPLWIGLLHPAAAILFAWAFARSAVITTIRGGLSWRGTFYSVEELKKGTVR